MTTQTALNVITALSWVVAVSKLPSLLRRPRDVARRFYLLILLDMALALTLLLPPFYFGFDHLSGVPNLARLLSNGCGLATTWAAQALLVHLTYPANEAAIRTRRVGIALGGAFLLMAVCFARAPLRVDALDFTGRFQSTPYIAEYRLIFLAALGLGMGNASRLFWRYANLATRRTLRLGLHLCAASSALGLAYVANEALRSGDAAFGMRSPVPHPNIVSQVLLVTFIAVGLVGVTVAAWGPRLGFDVGGRWLANYRSLQRLYPLWCAIYRVNPEIALAPPASRLADLLSWRRVDFRLYRRVVEIRDGWLLLRPSMDARVAALAKHLAAEALLPPSEARPVIDAATLAVALRAPVGANTLPYDEPVPEPSDRADFQSEVESLERVARCFRRSAIVRSVVARYAAESIARLPAIRGKR